MKVGFIGLGKLGMPCAEAMAEAHDVTGFDVDARKSRGVRIVPRLQEAVEGQDLVFIAVPTPHSREYDGRLPVSRLPTRDFDYSMARGVLADIRPFTRPGQIIVLISTCLPGTVRRELAPAAGDVTLVYNPYFIAMGTVAADFLNPEFLAIGTEDGSAERIGPLLEFYKGLIRKFKPKLGTWEEAESIKIFYNTFISFKIGFANMIQDVAVKLGHMNVDVVTEALAGATCRLISPMYLKAGMGDGGPCHPRDNIALKDLADRLGLGYDLFGGIMEAREVQARNLARTLAGFGNPVVIMGKAFKPGVALTDGSYGILVAHYVGEIGISVAFHDPMTGDREPSGPGSFTYLIAHDSSWAYEHSFRPGSVVVDPWRRLTRVEGCRVVRYGDTRAC